MVFNTMLNYSNTMPNLSSLLIAEDSMKLWPSLTEGQFVGATVRNECLLTIVGFEVAFR